MRHASHGPPSRLHWKPRRATAGTKRKTAVELLLTVARPVLTLVVGTGLDDLGRVRAEIDSRSPAEQFVFCAKGWIWL